MADDQPTSPPGVDAFTGRMYYVEYTLRMVVPIPLGGSPTTDPVDIQKHFGGVIHTILRQLPFISSFKFQASGTPRSEEVFLPNADAVKDRMRIFMEECENSTEQATPRGRLIVMPGGGQPN